MQPLFAVLHEYARSNAMQAFKVVLMWQVASGAGVASTSAALCFGSPVRTFYQTTPVLVGQHPSRRQEDLVQGHPQVVLLQIQWNFWKENAQVQHSLRTQVTSVRELQVCSYRSVSRIPL